MLTTVKISHMNLSRVVDEFVQTWKVDLSSLDINFTLKSDSLRVLTAYVQEQCVKLVMPPVRE